MIKQITGDWLYEQFHGVTGQNPVCDWNELAHRINQFFNDQPTREMVGWTTPDWIEQFFIQEDGSWSLPIIDPVGDTKIKLTIYPDEVRIKEVKE